MDDVVTNEFLTRLRAFIRRRVRSDEVANEIVQEVLLKFLRDRGEIRNGRGPAWMFTVARREIVNRYRRASQRMENIPEHLPAADAMTETSTLQELSHCVQPLLDRLQDNDSAILRRVDLEAESQAAIADEMGVPRSTVKARVQRARERFHRELAACCAVAVDSRGMPISYEPRRDGGCSCDVQRS